MKKFAFLLIIATVLAGSGSLSWAQAAKDLTQLSLEELMNVQVTTVSKTPQQMSKVPAAIYVLTNEDIRRSGATSIPEALRSVPGLHVARIDANKWAISIRGFQERFGNKLLVMIDGRSVYTPLFAGVFWDIQDTLLEDVERIEVIRGPGGTIWGANAVNGIINIITKSAKDTHGNYVGGGYGTKEAGFGEFRVGQHIETFHFRGYGKYFNRENSINGEDDWRFGRGGFRTDWDVHPDGLLTFQGDFYEGDSGTTLTRFSMTRPFSSLQNVNEDKKGGNLLGRYTHRFGEATDLEVQGYFDHTYLDANMFAETRDTWDIDARLRFPVSVVWKQEIIVGGGFRNTKDNIRGSFETSAVPTKRSDDTASWFVQDEIWFVEDRLAVTLGSKFEHNDYTGFEHQPRASAAFYPDEKSTFWGAITRAVRTPSRAEDDVIFQAPVVDSGFFGLPVVSRVTGDRDYDSETVLSYEAGYRSLVTDQLSVDLAGYYNEYDHLRTTQVGSLSFLGTHFLVPSNFDNRMEAETYGGEAALTVLVTPQWRLRSGYTYLYIKVHPEPTSNDLGQTTKEGSPQHQGFIHSSMDLPWNLKLDGEVRYTGEIPVFDVKDYWVFDVRIAWNPRPDLELSVAAFNLFEADHFEARGGQADFLGAPRRAESSVYGKLTLKF